MSGPRVVRNWTNGLRKASAGEPGPWATRLAWLLLPFAAGPTLAAALDPRVSGVRLVATVALWGLWAAALTASLVPRAITLTVIRIVMPVALPTVVWAATSGAPAGAGAGQAVLAIAWAFVVAITVLSPLTGEAFVDGSSYGPERRLCLRAPATLLLGPIPAAWAVAAAGVLTGPLLLAAHRWIAGGLALVVGIPAAAVAVRALHGLSRRWVVFVPAGLVLHDPLNLSEPVLFPRRLVAGIGPAPAGADADAGVESGTVDLTGGAPGLVLRLDLREPLPIGRTERGGGASTDIHAQRVLFSPSRPGAVLREALDRRLPAAIVDRFTEPEPQSP